MQIAATSLLVAFAPMQARHGENADADADADAAQISVGAASQQHSHAAAAQVARVPSLTQQPTGSPAADLASPHGVVTPAQRAAQHAASWMNTHQACRSNITLTIPRRRFNVMDLWQSQDKPEAEQFVSECKVCVDLSQP